MWKQGLGTLHVISSNEYEKGKSKTCICRSPNLFYICHDTCINATVPYVIHQNAILCPSYPALGSEERMHVL